MINLKIFYGSQTGNAEDLAEKLYKFSLNLPQDYVTSEINEMNFFDFNSLSNNDLIIFICSTTGQGDPPDNMKFFWKTLMSRFFKGFLKSFDFGIFGLGDSKYIKYNFIAKKLYRRLGQFDVKPIIDLGLADDQHALGIDGDFIPWVKNLWIYFENKLNKFVNTYNLYENCTKIQSFNKYDIDFVDFHEDLEICPSEFTKLCVESNVMMTPSNHFQDTRLITFSSEDLKYDVGNVFSVYPKNSKNNVNTFFDLTNLNKFDVVSVTCVNKYFKLPPILRNSFMSFEKIVEQVFDLNCVPRKSFFENFAFLSQYAMEKERLLELSDANNIDDLYSYCFQPKRTIIEVLQDFPQTTKNISVAQWINLLPFIRPREYSIASSYNVHDKKIQILVSRVRYKTKMYTERVGLCSNFLCDLTSYDYVFGKVNLGSLKFPNNNFPVILIGPGTGIAAFRGFLSERMMEERTGCTLLCFGNRYRERDFYFSNEFERYEKLNKLKLLTAFSREEKVYIQNKLKQQSTILWKIVNDPNGFIFVSGRSEDMPQQVYDEIKLIIMNEGNISESQANFLLTNMQKFKRYQIETWS